MKYRGEEMEERTRTLRRHGKGVHVEMSQPTPTSHAVTTAPGSHLRPQPIEDVRCYGPSDFLVLLGAAGGCAWDLAKMNNEAQPVRLQANTLQANLLN